MTQALHEAAERSRLLEMERAWRRLARGEEPQRVVEEFSRALTNKLMHAPMKALNQASGEERAALVATVHRLYCTLS